VFGAQSDNMRRLSYTEHRAGTRGATMKTRSRKMNFAFFGLPNLAVWRGFVVYLFVAAFAFQSCATQSHIHFSSASGISGKLADRGSPQASNKFAGHFGEQQKPDRYPLSDDPSNCPICQQIALAGHVLTAGATSLIPPSEITFYALTNADVLILISGVSHAWRGRAPPSI
jgi:hypothetical protein